MQKPDTVKKKPLNNTVFAFYVFPMEARFRH